jgi:curved DNA-binding protein CbpA
VKPDYYLILGISRTGSQEDIKSAFRSLAMRYHPDKNAAASTEIHEKFRLIMEAYSLLSNKLKRKKYDSGLNYKTQYLKKSDVDSTFKNKTKRYSFTEKELQNRQAFYRSYRAKKEEQKKQENEIPSYSDFKYIMVSIPLAIGLLFFVINGFNNKTTKQKINITEGEVRDFLPTTNITVPDTGQIKKLNFSSPLPDLDIEPWNKVFGKPLVDTASKIVLKVRNNSTCEVVVCIYDIIKKRVIRNNYISQNNFIYIQNLPKGKYRIENVYGKNWIANKLTTDFIYEGIFDTVYFYCKMNHPSDIFSISEKNMNRKDTLIRKIISVKNVLSTAKTTNHNFFWN